MTDQHLDVLDAIHTTRAMRRLAPDPVPDELIRTILEAGTSAPSAANRQAWAFLVVKDPEVKRRIQHYYAKALDVANSVYAGPPPAGVTEEQYRRQHEVGRHLTEHFHEAPVWIVACLDTGTAKTGAMHGASIYPAVQNMLLAARALGLGSTLTCRHLVYQAEVDDILGLPETVHSFAILPIGYPLGKFGPVRRGPLEEVVHGDRWGTPYSWDDAPAD